MIHIPSITTVEQNVLDLLEPVPQVCLLFSFVYIHLVRVKVASL